MWIESDLYSKQGKAITNFSATLPQPESDLANAATERPILFRFLDDTREGRLRPRSKKGLVEHIQKVLIELGTGFAFVGRQYRIEVEGETVL